MKKVGSLVLAVCLLLGCFGCQNQQDALYSAAKEDGPSSSLAKLASPPPSPEEEELTRGADHPPCGRGRQPAILRQTVPAAAPRGGGEDGAHLLQPNGVEPKPGHPRAPIVHGTDGRGGLTTWWT